MPLRFLAKIDRVVIIRIKYLAISGKTRYSAGMSMGRSNVMRISRSETITVRAYEVSSYGRGVGQARINRARSGNFVATGEILAGFVTSGSTSVPGFRDSGLDLCGAGQPREYSNGRRRGTFHRHNNQSWCTGKSKRLCQHIVFLQYAAVILM